MLKKKFKEKKNDWPVAPGTFPLNATPGVTKSDHVDFVPVEDAEQASALKVHIPHSRDAVGMTFDQAHAEPYLHLRRRARLQQEWKRQ